MGDTFAISALVRKRAELSGELIGINKQRRSVMDKIDKVDAVLVTLGYTGWPEAIKPRRKQTRLFKRGRLRRMLADIRRERPDLIHALDIASEIMRRMRWNENDLVLLEAVVGKVKLLSSSTKVWTNHLIPVAESRQIDQ
jgi:hypothetical protein